MEVFHTPVLVDEVVRYIAPRDGGVYVDCTIGEGGHAEAVLSAFSGGCLVGIDKDPNVLSVASKRLERFGSRVFLVNDTYENLKTHLDNLSIKYVNGVLFDLGLSSYQLEARKAGFSYKVDEPLDMRFNPREGATAAELINTVSEDQLSAILSRYGEERWAKRIASFVVKAREREPITRTSQLVEIIKDAVPASARRKGVHPARRTFQALRIAVNDEIETFARALPKAIHCVGPGGRILVISYHSLEDRITKLTFRLLASESREPRVRLVTKKPIRPGDLEVQKNPRSRSAKLRVAERVS